MSLEQHTPGWFYVDASQEKQGPFPPSELKALADDGVIKESTLVWSEAYPDWIPAKDLTGLITGPDRSSSSAESSSPPPGAPQPARPLSMTSMPVRQESPPLATRLEPTASEESAPRGGQLVQTLAKFSLPAVVAAGAVCWTIFWLVHDQALALLPAEGIRIPTIVLLVIYGGVGFGLGNILGLCLRLAGFRSMRGAKAICALFVLTAAVLGEILFGAVVVALGEDPLTVKNVISFLAEPFAGQELTTFLSGIMGYLLRSLLAVGAIVGATAHLDPKDVEDGSEACGIPA